MKVKMANMDHLNGNILCAVAIERTGSKLFYHDVCQLSIIPLDHELRILKQLLPFHCDIKPRYINRIDLDEMTISRERMQNICKHGLDPLVAADLLEQWFERLPMYHKKKIMPMSYNWAETYPFLCNMLGQRTTEYVFDYRYRDLLPISVWLNDYSYYKINTYPFSKNNFTYLCSSLGIERADRTSRDSLSDARTMIDIYRSSMHNISILEIFERSEIKEPEPHPAV